MARKEPVKVPPLYVPVNLSVVAKPDAPAELGKVRVTDAEPPEAILPNDAGTVAPFAAPSVDALA